MNCDICQAVCKIPGLDRYDCSSCGLVARLLRGLQVAHAKSPVSSDKKSPPLGKIVETPDSDRSVVVVETPAGLQTFSRKVLRHYHGKSEKSLTGKTS